MWNKDTISVGFDTVRDVTKNTAFHISDLLKEKKIRDGFTAKEQKSER